MPSLTLVRSRISARARVLLALATTLALLAGFRIAIAGATEPTPEASLARVLGRSGLTVGTVIWLSDESSPWTLRPAVFLGRRAGELDDLFYCEVRPGRGGALLDVSGVVNLTRSAAAAEEQLVRSGPFLVFASRAADRVEAITLLDLRGEPEQVLRSFTPLQRTQHAITNLQETGRVEGLGRARYQLATASELAEITVREGRFEVAIEGGRLVIDPARPGQLALGEELAEVQAVEPGVPGGITWVVDTVRNLPFVGREPIEWLENRVFAFQDFWDRTRHALVGSESTEEAVAAELGTTAAEVVEQMTEERRALLTAAEAEIGFPPPPLRPVLRGDPVEGEGVWIPVIDDPFVNQYPGAPPAFAQTFIRPDPERPYARVYVTLWDARQVQLRIMPGTREPESATGELGSGLIPRDPRTLRTLVGAFNGGFQAMHGEFGMMADGHIYLPPKPWAATVAVFDDGRVGLGSWPAPSWRGRYFDEDLANQQVPEGMTDMRQNLTSVVEDGRFNPWARWWWGAAPAESEEQTYTYRSGLCLTEEGFLGFFWGTSLGPEALGNAMIAARCARGMHLDMNSGHCGFEFLRPYREGDVEPVGELRREFESDEALTGAAGWRIRARKAVRTMAMRFPRYTSRDPRDFFYLTLRPVLPGPPLEAGAEQIPLSTVGLPHAGWPYAFARALVGDVWVVRIDPRRAVPSAIAAPDDTRVLAGFSAPVPRAGPLALMARRATVGWRFEIGRPSGDDHALVAGPRLSESPAALAAVGIDADGFIVYAEMIPPTAPATPPRRGTPGSRRAESVSPGIPPTAPRLAQDPATAPRLAQDPGPSATRLAQEPGPSATRLAHVLAMAGVGEAIALPAGAFLALVGEGGGSAPDGETPRSVSDAGLAFLADEGPATEVLFPDNTPRPYSHWGFLQGQRVRYFPEHPPRFLGPNADAGPATP